MVVLRSMSLVITPPLVSIPRLSGVTSSSRTCFHLTLEHTGLQRGDHGNNLVGVDALLGSLPPVSSLTRSVTAGIRVEPPTSTMVDVADRDAGVPDDRLERLARAVQQIRVIFWTSSGQLLVEEQRVLVGVDGDVGQVDRRSASWTVRLAFGRFTQPLHGHLVLGQVDARGGLELVDQPFDDPVVPVVAAEVVVAGWRGPRPHRRRSRAARRRTCRRRGRRPDGLFLAALCPGRTPARPRWAR